MNKDRALKVLEDVLTESNFEIPFRLIKEAYETESEYLFEDDSKPMGILRQIVEDYVDETPIGGKK